MSVDAAAAAAAAASADCAVAIFCKLCSFVFLLALSDLVVSIYAIAEKQVPVYPDQTVLEPQNLLIVIS